MMNILIRSAEKRDMEAIVQLCALHAAYEKAEYSSEGKLEKLERDLFSDNPQLYCLVVEFQDEVVGYATFMKQYATWDAAEYIYMDCIYVNEAMRSQGIGEKLIERIKVEGAQLDCSLIQWQTPDFNEKAMKFYRRIGATSKSKERFFLNV